MTALDELMFWLRELDGDLRELARVGDTRNRWGRRFCCKWDRDMVVKAIKRIRKGEK